MNMLTPQIPIKKVQLIVMICDGCFGDRLFRGNHVCEVLTEPR